VDTAAAEGLMDALRAQFDTLPGKSFAGRTVASADEFSYDDPVDGSHSAGQGIRIAFEGGGRAVFRLSGTGTVGATLRVYLEDVCEDPDQMHRDPQEALADIIDAAEAIAGIKERTGRTEPDVRT
jgi:phosphoglucomutase